MRVFFARFDEKHNLLERFKKIFQNFRKKIAKNDYFCIFFKKFNKPYVSSLRVWTKNANCWEIVGNFLKFSMQILLKN